MQRGEIETRTIEIGAAGSVIEGLAVPYNTKANIGGLFLEQFAPGSLSKSIRSRDVLALMAHDHGRVLGRTSSGTLRFSDTGHGLAFELDPETSTPDGSAAKGLVGRADLKGISPGFYVMKEAWDDNGPLPLRTIIEAELLEISIVGMPAYEDTTAALRSLDEHRKASNHSAAKERLLRKAEAMHRMRGI
ncbi:HK97 family phage prohead protease [Mesorhizobium sp. LjNodule214]|uniref:HK97 family phage prohead protease n=1 Tax=Mesorhizobium sp. LjNodule214 TaxID=3342252 RepID=UPI003ED14EB8